MVTKHWVASLHYSAIESQGPFEMECILRLEEKNYTKILQILAVALSWGSGASALTAPTANSLNPELN
jgi:hypothetical protein